ncbi:MAG: radical SAM protein [Bacillota bacterium]
MAIKQTEDLLSRAWQTRRAYFAPRIEFVYPYRTLAVSSTGRDCALNCAHCGGYYLKHMQPLAKTKTLAQRDTKIKSFLVSGGCDRQGKVPHLAKLAEIKALAAQGALNLHTGLVTEEEAAALGKVAGVVSFDLLVDGETIKDVYGLQAAPRYFMQSYRLLRKYTRVVPHLCLGLYKGAIRGEYRALEFLREEGAEALTFIVFTPTPGTAFAGYEPPPVEEVGHFLATARLMFPRLPLSLGCMRPGGNYRKALDCTAINAGINKIVQPAPAARLLAGELGLAIVKGEECCSL